MGRWIANRKQTLSATRTTSGGKAGEHGKNAGDTCDRREQVAVLANRPTRDRQTDENGDEEKQALPSWQFLCGAIAHGAPSRLTPAVSRAQWLKRRGAEAIGRRLQCDVRQNRRRQAEHSAMSTPPVLIALSSVPDV